MFRRLFKLWNFYRIKAINDYIVGLGGTDLSKKHAINSSKLINQINPDFID